MQSAKIYKVYEVNSYNKRYTHKSRNKKKDNHKKGKRIQAHKLSRTEIYSTQLNIKVVFFIKKLLVQSGR